MREVLVTQGGADEALLGIAHLVMDASVRAADDLGGLYPVQLRALTALRQMRGANLAQLAAEIGVTVSTASRLVDRLIAADWVHRRPSANNRREISLTLTEAGSSLLCRYDRLRVERLRDWLNRLAPERRDVVVHALTDLVSVANR